MGSTMSKRVVRSLLALVFAFPIDAVSGGQLDLFVHLLDRLFHGAAEVTAADTVLDGNVTPIALAIDFRSAIGLAYFAELCERYPFPRRREQANAFDRFLRIAIFWQIAQREVVSRFALENLGERVAANRGLNRILHVRDVDLVTGGGLAIHGHVKVGLAEDTENSEILNAIDFSHNADDFVALLFENFQIVAVDLRGQRAFHPAHRLFHIVFNGLRKTPDDTGNFVEFTLHGRDQFVFVLVKDRPPLLFRFQVHEVLGVKEAGVIRSVIWTPYLAGALRNLGE